MSLCLGSQFGPAVQFWSPGQGTAARLWHMDSKPM